MQVLVVFSGGQPQNPPLPLFVPIWMKDKKCKSMLEKVMGDIDAPAKEKRCQLYENLRTDRNQHAHPSDRAAFERQIAKSLISLEKRFPLPAGDTHIQEAYQILKKKSEILSCPHPGRRPGWRYMWK